MVWVGNVVPSSLPPACDARTRWRPWKAGRGNKEGRQVVGPSRGGGVIQHEELIVLTSWTRLPRPRLTRFGASAAAAACMWG